MEKFDEITLVSILFRLADICIKPSPERKRVHDAFVPIFHRLGVKPPEWNKEWKQPRPMTEGDIEL